MRGSGSSGRRRARARARAFPRRHGGTSFKKRTSPQLSPRTAHGSGSSGRHRARAPPMAPKRNKLMAVESAPPRGPHGSGMRPRVAWVPVAQTEKAHGMEGAHPRGPHGSGRQPRVAWVSLVQKKPMTWWSLSPSDRRFWQSAKGWHGTPWCRPQACQGVQERWDRAACGTSTSVADLHSSSTRVRL